MKVLYKKGIGAGTAVTETPETERVKKNQQNISAVSFSIVPLYSNYYY